MPTNKIRTVSRVGHLKFIRVMASDYSRIKRDYLDDFGIALPDEKTIDVQDDRDLRILDNDVFVHIIFESRVVYRYRFKKGWIYDTASVPPAMRGIIDNDDRRLVIAAMVHDANFSGHFLTFRETNRIFYQMAVLAGYPRPRASIAWLAVSSFVGYYIFQRSKKSGSVKQARKFVWFDTPWGTDARAR